MAFFFRLSFVLLFLFPVIAQATDYTKDKEAFIEENLKQTRYDIDTSASAIILYEKYEYQMVKQDHYYITCKVHRVIKILKKSGFDYADVDVHTYHSKNHYSSIKKITGTTYNFSNGEVVAQSLDNENKSAATYTHINEKKFSMPGVEVGSVIDYTYETEQDLTTDFAEWVIQSHIPKLYSELEVFVLGQFEVLSLDQALHTYTPEKAKDVHKDDMPDAYTFDDNIIHDGLSKHWVRKNIPAIEDEPYVSDINNYREQKQLFITAHVSNGARVDQNNTWDKANTALFKSVDFYKALYKNNDTITTKATEVTIGSKDELDKARKIYNYVRDSFTVNGYETIWVHKYPGKVLADKSGNETEINMLLIAMLKAADIDCDPIILSTKDNGRVSNAFPDMSSFNYTICQASLGGQKYLLDASGKYNPFGIIPAKCYNGYSRIINKEGGEVIMLPDDAKERSFIKLETTDNTANNYTISISVIYGEYDAMKNRENWNTDESSIRKAVLDFLQKLPFPATLKTFNVKNLKNTDGHLELDITAGMEWPGQEQMIYFNPYFASYYMAANPFKSESRNFPVEFPYAINATYYLKMQFPDGYKMDENVKPLNVRFGENLKYQDAVSYDEATNILTINANLSRSETRYKVADYPSLKKFYDAMISQQQKNVVIKKQ